MAKLELCEPYKIYSNILKDEEIKGTIKMIDLPSMDIATHLFLAKSQEKD